eukprot:TRINITY_DN10230_c1_g1_i1.p1 TRINITY_DN10230_c1_g1~~TRINITY_DN10230_c1_g1_i1.p1  ORF type:complete len:671 (+),score=73.86 TRINITY_DN10230_c1_g1_i1:47-2014(+)
MAAVVTLLSLCFAIPPCTSDPGSHCIGVVARPMSKVHRVAVSHGDTLAAALSNSELHVYNLSTGGTLAVPSYDTVRGFAFSPDDDRVAVALWDGGVAVASLITGEELWSRTLDKDCYSVAYSPDGTRLASGHADGRIYIWNAVTGDFVFTPAVSDLSGVYALAYTVDGGRVISSGGFYDMVVWNATTGHILKKLRYNSRVKDVQVSPDGLYFTSLAQTGNSGNHEINIYKLSDYSVHRKIRFERSKAAVCFSQDSSKLVAVGYHIEVYSVETGDLLELYNKAYDQILHSEALDRWRVFEPTAVAYFHTNHTTTILMGEGPDGDGTVILWADVATHPPQTSAPPTPRPTHSTPAPPTAAPPSPAPATHAPVTPAPRTLAPKSPPRVCTKDATCRVFGSESDNCTSSQRCVCKYNSGALCEINPLASAIQIEVKMGVIITLQVPCDRAGLQVLLDTLRAAATARGAQDVSVGASCGTLSVAVSGVVPEATIATTTDVLIDAISAAALAHPGLTNVMHDSQLDPFVQTTQQHTDTVCTQHARSTVETYDGRCLVLSCINGYSLKVDTRDRRDYHTCTQAPVDTSESGDDGLSEGAIASIVVGCVVVVVAIALVWWVRRPKYSQQQDEPLYISKGPVGAPHLTGIGQHPPAPLATTGTL